MNPVTFTAGDDFGQDIINRVTVEWLMQQLNEEEREILYLWIVEDMTFTEIGEIVGLKYRGRALTGSTIRYHKNRIRAKLLTHAEAVGMQPPRVNPPEAGEIDGE